MSDQQPPVPPTIHRMEGELKVCDPMKTDHTKDMESWRILKIMGEIVDGFDLLKKYSLAASFFGSARYTLEPRMYQDAEALAGKLSRSNFAVITGGGPGIMEAANKGAKEAGGASIGLNIKLPQEQYENPYLTDALPFNYFFTRRVMLSFASEVYIFFPGGFGTMDELFEILTLVQTNKIKRIPIILYGADFWGKVVGLMESELLQGNHVIDSGDLDLFVVVDSVDEAYEKILTLVKC
ncbi:MAG: TIGR00730 family Rossman fold protein [Candidatus Pacebacteria bacterium]|nr:TIGR00730 family Rossman fold protein [Candidatus Paceibacterota bacterium]